MKTAWSPANLGVRAAQRARLIHAALRHLVLHHPNFAYDRVQCGEPINQEDMACILMTFSVVSFEAARKLGIALTPPDARAWMHHWRVTGHLLGIEEHLLRHDFVDGALLLEAIRQRHLPRRSSKFCVADNQLTCHNAMRPATI